MTIDDDRLPAKTHPAASVRQQCDDQCDELDFTPADPFRSVLEAEYDEVRRRRAADTGGIYPPDAGERPRALAGIALSGGGIRSATFNLGLLQALQRRGVLQRFDFLSTVSGGGYCGGWWSAWLSRDERREGEVFPPDERIEPQRHEIRHAEAVNAYDADAARDHLQLSDSAMSAATDPIHHLRLFSNFLTPRKGILSADTWRAVTSIGRNLVLTWLVLLPLMLAAVMVGQAYFALTTGNEFEHRLYLRDDVDTAATSAIGSAAMAAEANVDAAPAGDLGPRLLRRLRFALGPSVFLLIGVVVCVVPWMIATRKCWKLRDVIATALTALAFSALTVIILIATDTLPSRAVIAAIGGASAIFLTLLVIAGLRGARQVSSGFSENDYWRNQIVRFQTKLLQWSVFLAAILLFAGFGHEVIDFLLYDTRFHDWAGAEVVRAGGWGAILMTALGAAYTALKASPRGGDDKQTATPNRFDRIVFAVVPPLLLFVLGVVLAWIGHRWYGAVYEDHNREIWYITIATVVSAFLFLVLALYEFRPRSPKKMAVLIFVWLAAAIGARFVSPAEIEAHLLPVTLGAIVFMGGSLIVRGPVRDRRWGAIALCAIAAIATAAAARHQDLGALFDPLPIETLAYTLLAGILFSVILLVFELAWGEGSNARSFSLMAFGFAMLALVAIAACSPNELAWRAMAIFGCIATITGWVLALGWLADPNVLTVHGFYKARLVRAYMGASNEARARARQAEITDAVPGDDVLLRDLQNTRQGAPYHLINTTLNLVGARDLATVQRFSDSFVMSKLYCGSLRTGYRRTDEYACGTLSLGTAVSVSGAAASPNMGGQTPSASLAMLLTLFNVRLGFWAPTPNRGYWRAGAARAWPFYTIQELLSQTTDLLPFCYLTDGGHFDNTGVYSLVQRGCRYILFSDCGADPRPAFADLGDIVRKVRIDFGTEIDIDIKALLESPPTSHFVAGTIRYSDVHAEMIGLPADERTGMLIVVKPNRTAGASVDVLQYGFDNDAFPQQTTADQWYDEQQFESYRRLGTISGDSIVREADLVNDLAAFFEKRLNGAAA